MGMELIIGAAVGGLTALDSFTSAEATRANQKYQASALASNAAAMRQQADLTRKATEAAQREKDREREALRRAYESEAGSNRALLAASGVDITSGSAADVLLGNAGRFATDMGENRLEREWVGWTGNRQADLQTWQGDVYDSQSSYLKKTAGSLGNSLLSSIVKGGVAGLGAYTMAGGKLALAGGDSGGLGHVFDGNRSGGIGGSGWGRALGTR